MDVATFSQRRVPLAAAPAGDQRFESFFRASYADLVRALTAITRDVGAAEELVQEAMARVYDRWDRVALMESPVGYVYTVAVNLDRRQRRRQLLRRAAGASPPAASPDLADAVSDRSDLLAAIARLPRGQRDALLLVESFGLDTAHRLTPVTLAR